MSLALFWLCKFGLAQICEDSLKNMDNKSFKKQRKTASSSYPPRNWSRMREQNPHSRICAGVWVLCLQKREAITNMKDKERFREVYGKP